VSAHALAVTLVRGSAAPSTEDALRVLPNPPGHELVLHPWLEKLNVHLISAQAGAASIAAAQPIAIDRALSPVCILSFARAEITEGNSTSFGSSKACAEDPLIGKSAT
jgi:hypothetical protein